MGGDLGTTRTLYSAFGSLGPTYVGVVAETANYTLAFQGLVVCLLASTAITSWLAVH